MLPFDYTLVNGISESHKKIAEAIAAFIDADISEPKLSDDREAWESDVALRHLEKAIGYDAGHWDRYADVCMRAAALVESASGKALLRLSQLNGERRIVEPKWEWVAVLAEQVLDLICGLKSGSRKERLAGLLEYHLGIIARYTGDYARAALKQVEVAEKAEKEGDLVGSAIARLCEAVERINIAISNGKDVAPLLGPLNRAAHKVVDVCTGDDPTQVAWRCYSAPVHVLQAYIWGFHRIIAREEKFWMKILTEELPRVDRTRYDNLLPTITAIQAGLAFLKNYRGEALRFANEVETTLRDRAAQDARMTARFVMAMLAADEYLRVIIEDGGHMHQLRRMARRILAGEVRQWCFKHAVVGGKV